MPYLRCVKIDAPSTHGSIVLELPNVSFTRMLPFDEFIMTDDYNLTETEGNVEQMYVADPESKSEC